MPLSTGHRGRDWHIVWARDGRCHVAPDYGLIDSELADLGFRRIAGSNLIYRHSALKSDFSEKHPFGLDIPADFEASESDEAWVLREWEKTKNSGEDNS